MENFGDLWVFVALALALPFLGGLRRWVVEKIPAWARLTFAATLVAAFLGFLLLGIVAHACGNGDLGRDSAICQFMGD